MERVGASRAECPQEVVIVVVVVVVVEYNTFYIIIIVGVGVPRMLENLLYFTIHAACHVLKTVVSGRPRVGRELLL